MCNRPSLERSCCAVWILGSIVAGGLSAQGLPAFRTIYNAPDQAQSTESWLVTDKSGSLFGTAGADGAFGQGTVFQLTPPQTPGGAWKKHVLYAFTGGADGGTPDSGVFFGPHGELYGTTDFGGDAPSGLGVVFQLIPSTVPGDPWKETVIHSFGGLPDGGGPGGNLVIGDSGEIYGSTQYGGELNEGTVYMLSPPATLSEGWQETILVSFPDRSGAIHPNGLTGSGRGLIYGTAFSGGAHGVGTVFALKPSPAAGDSWVETSLHSFDVNRDGSYPGYGVAVGATGILYGLTFSGGASGFGTLYALHPPEDEGGEWTSVVLHSFTGGSDGGAPVSVPVIGTDGRLYGTTAAGGNAAGLAGDGVLFTFSEREGTETVLHQFEGPDGHAPEDNLCLGPDGAIYGISTLGGARNGGTVFEWK